MTAQALRLAVIGTGKMGQAHATAAASLGHKMVAGCAARPDSDSWRNFVRTYPYARAMTAESICDASDIDAVIVALPWHEMPRRLAWLLRCPKPMLLEKPVALGTADLAAAVAGADKSTGNKRVAMNRRFYGTVRRLAERIGQGGLLSADIIISEDVVRLERTLGPEIVPHLLAYNSCHILDVALFLLGPMQADCVVRTPSADPRLPSIRALLSCGTKVPVGLSLYADMPAEIGIRCYFDDRTIWSLAPMERLRVFDGYDIEEPSPAIPIRRYTPRAALDIWVETRFKPGIVEQMANFCQGGPAPAATLDDARLVLGLIEALQGSA